MSFTLATWNINSVRLREPIVLKPLATIRGSLQTSRNCRIDVKIDLPDSPQVNEKRSVVVSRCQSPNPDGTFELSNIPWGFECEVHVWSMRDDMEPIRIPVRMLEPGEEFELEEIQTGK